MKQDLQSRIHSMYQQDCLMAWVDVILLWGAVAFVLFDTLSFIQDENIRLVLYAASSILILFNTASVTAMVRHYAEDKQFIYGLDIKHLDANRALAEARQTGAGALAGK